VSARYRLQVAIEIQDAKLPPSRWDERLVALHEYDREPVRQWLEADEARKPWIRLHEANRHG
jgi:hypothetical protein